jgi:hypothetical protein
VKLENSEKVIVDWPFATQKVAVVWYRDLADYIEQQFGQSYDIPERYDLGNYSYLKLDISPLTDYSHTLHVEMEQDFVNWRDFGGHVDLEYLLTKLYEQSKIPVGKLLVLVWW